MKNIHKVIKEIRKEFSGVLANELFEIRNDSIIEKESLKSKSLKKIQAFSDSALLDVAAIFFKDKLGATKIILTNSLNPTVNCYEGLLKVSPTLLQKIFKNSFIASINLNKAYFENRIYSKTLDDFIFYIYSDKNKLRKEIKRNGIDANILAFELIRISTFINYEITNLLTFIYGHETYHFLTACKENQHIEADGLGILGFQFLNYLINYDIERLKIKYIPKGLIENFNKKSENDDFINLFLGRNIDRIVFELYTKTEYEKGSSSHLNLNDRIIEINKLIKIHPDILYKKYINNKILSNHENN